MFNKKEKIKNIKLKVSQSMLFVVEDIIKLCEGKNIKSKMLPYEKNKIYNDFIVEAEMTDEDFTILREELINKVSPCEILVIAG